MDISRLRPREGDDVERWWESVIQWARTLTVEIGPGMKATQIAGGGLRLIVDRVTTVRTPFSVAVTGRRATITPGYLGDRVPYIVADDLAVRLDGTRADGITPDPLGRPELALRSARPGEDGRSAIALRVRVGESGAPLDDREDPEALQVVHVSEFGPAEKRRLWTEERIALQELAVIYWTAGGREPDRRGQVVRHNLRLSTAEGRAFFSAV